MIRPLRFKFHVVWGIHYLLHAPLCGNVALAHLGRLHHELVSVLVDNELGELCRNVEQELFWALLPELCDKQIWKQCDK